MTATDSKRDFIWNMAGSLTYALSSMVLAFFVMRVLGEADGGIFGFGFSTFGQQIFIIAYFGIRPFHITDAGRSYSFGVYRRLRVVTVLLALFCASLYLLFYTGSGIYTPHKAAVLLLLALYKIIDGYADVYESECQREGMLWLGGRGLCFRTLCSMLCFMLAAGLTKNLLFAAFAGVLTQLLGLYFFNVKPFQALTKREQKNVSYKTSPDRTRALFRSTLLLFVSVFLDFYVFSAAKYAIDLNMSDEASGIFNILFMPTSVIYLVANFIIKPFMTRLAAAYETGDQKTFQTICSRLQLIIIGLTLLAALGVQLLGGFVLRILELMLGVGYAGKLTEQKTAFLLIILGGGMYALANLYYYILVILRKQNAIFLVYVLGAGAAVIAAPLLVEGFGLSGAAVCYVWLMCILQLGFLLLGRRYVKAAFQS